MTIRVADVDKVVISLITSKASFHSLKTPKQMKLLLRKFVPDSLFGLWSLDPMTSE
jgi:hypothetical protein